MKENSSFIPYPLAFRGMPLLPRNCKGYESRTHQPLPEPKIKEKGKDEEKFILYPLSLCL
jgi:hypothetical protein